MPGAFRTFIGVLGVILEPREADSVPDQHIQNEVAGEAKVAVLAPKLAERCERLDGKMPILRRD